MNDTQPFIKGNPGISLVYSGKSLITQPTEGLRIITIPRSVIPASDGNT